MLSFGVGSDGSLVKSRRGGVVKSRNTVILHWGIKFKTACGTVLVLKKIDPDAIRKVCFFEKWLVVTVIHYIVRCLDRHRRDERVVNPFLSRIKHFRSFIFLLLQDRHEFVADFSLIFIDKSM